MSKTCQRCQAAFEVYPDEQAFLQKIGWRFGDTVIHPPEPVYCPQCRMQIRTCHRNERNLYRRKPDKSGKPIISLYSDPPPWGEPYKVISQEEWRSDDFDPMQYGRDYDFDKPFFEQFFALQKAVPRMSLITVSNENCDYTTGTGYCRNCYLINSSENCEDCYYGKLLQTCKDSVDCSYLFDSQLCYECFSVYDSYNCRFLLFSKNCQDCFFSSGLQSCKKCLWCTDLHQKEYHVENKPVSKEEFDRRFSDLWGSHHAVHEARMKLLNLHRNKIHRFSNIVNSENCTGDYIENSKNCRDCYDMTDSEDCRYVQVGVNVKDNYDCSNMYLKIERCYEVLGTIEVFNCGYCIFVFHSNDLLYCDYCFNCQNCFGCSGLTRKKHCILNKQYTEEKYNALVPRIVEQMKQVGEWGSYFPIAFAPFGYNESLAHEYLPLTKEEATSKGFHWRENIDQISKVERIIPAEQLPDRIKDIPDDVLNWAIKCEATGRPFILTKQELAYYRKHNLPIPHIHPDERHRQRMELRNPRILWKRICMKCEKEIFSTFAPERQERVNCEECYLKVVY